MEKESIRAQITSLEVGESVRFSLADTSYSTLRTYTCVLGYETGNRYAGSLDRASRLFTVKRIA